MTTMNKRTLGQYFSTRASTLLDGMPPLPSLPVIEPFCGAGDLLRHCAVEGAEAYDIEPQHPGTVQRDTLLSPPDYAGKFVLTNPPFVAKNKAGSPAFAAYRHDDLYKCFLQTLVDGGAAGGMLILPLNFWSCTRPRDLELRRAFLEAYRVLRVNVFEARVFDDTSYAVCSLAFEARNDAERHVPFFFYPSGARRSIPFTEENHFSIGGELLDLGAAKTPRVSRVLEGDPPPNTRLTLRALDTHSGRGIALLLSDEPFYGKISSRMLASLNIQPPPSPGRQARLCEEFNAYVNELRDKYNSLCFTNFRDGKRKRIGFGVAYRIIQRLLLVQE